MQGRQNAVLTTIYLLNITLKSLHHDLQIWATAKDRCQEARPGSELSGMCARCETVPYMRHYDLESPNMRQSMSFSVILVCPFHLLPFPTESHLGAAWVEWWEKLMINSQFHYPIGHCGGEFSTSWLMFPISLFLVANPRIFGPYSPNWGSISQ